MAKNYHWYQNKLREKLRPYDEEGKTLLYAYLRASDGTPYYVGVSTGLGRAVDQKNHRKHGISVPKNPDLVVCLKSGLSREEAADYEQFFIKHYGRKDLGTGILHNKSDGGEGLQNPSAETRKRIGDRMRGKKLDPDHLAKFHAFNREPKSETHKQAISDAQPSKGGTHKPEHLAALEAAKQKMRLANAQAAGFDNLGDYDAHLKAKYLLQSREDKRKKRADAAALGMTKRAYEQWIKDGCPEDKSSYLKNSPRIEIPKQLSYQERRKYERDHYGFSEDDYRRWVKEGRPDNVEDYKLPPKGNRGGRPTKSGRPPLKELFPVTRTGQKAFADAYRKAGSWKALEEKFGVSKTSVKDHKKLLRLSSDGSVEELLDNA